MTFLQLQYKLYHCYWIWLKLFFPGKVYLATKRIPWKAFFYINPRVKKMEQTYGLNTFNCPRKNKEMVSLEKMAESNWRTVNYWMWHWTLMAAPLNLTTNQMQFFSTLTKNLNTLLILLSTCLHLWKNGFQTILPMKTYLKNQLFNIKMH